MFINVVWIALLLINVKIPQFIVFPATSKDNTPSKTKTRKEKPPEALFQNSFNLSQKETEKELLSSAHSTRLTVRQSLPSLPAPRQFVPCLPAHELEPIFSVCLPELIWVSFCSWSVSHMRSMGTLETSFSWKQLGVFRPHLGEADGWMGRLICDILVKYLFHPMWTWVLFWEGIWHILISNKGSSYCLRSGAANFPCMGCAHRQGCEHW